MQIDFEKVFDSVYWKFLYNGYRLCFESNWVNFLIRGWLLLWQLLPEVLKTGAKAPLNLHQCTGEKTQKQVYFVE